jgi:hypothetical protein
MSPHDDVTEETALCFRNGEWLTMVKYSVLLANRVVRNSEDGVTVEPSWTGVIRFELSDPVAEAIWRAPAGLELLLADGRHLSCQLLQPEGDRRQWMVRLTPHATSDSGKIDGRYTADDRVLAYLDVGRPVLVTDAEYLAYVTGLTTREVKAALRRLQANGLIRVGGNGHWTGNSYWTVCGGAVRQPA